MTITPVVGRGLAARVFERNVWVYRRYPVYLLAGMTEQLLYLATVGLGFGKLVGSVHVGGHAVRYVEFVAPALLATSAMNGAVNDSTFNVFFKLKFAKVYDAVVATPIRPSDIARGEVAWSLSRGALYATTFLVAMAALGLVHSWWALCALPATVLVGFCFGGMGMAATCYMRSWQDFDFVQLGTLPLFLFSSTFYPLTAYSPAVREVVRATPLYNGVALLRTMIGGGIEWSTLGHVAYLVVLGGLGVAIASRRLGHRLLH